MPVYLFTVHTHGSWMPDHPRGYTRRHEGVKASDPEMAENYRRTAKTSPVTLNRDAQQAVIAAVLEKANLKGWTLHGIATESTHVHILVSWTGYIAWLDVRRGLKTSMTLRLNNNIKRQKWWSAGGSRKRVEDRQHLDYLLQNYLPKHRGLTWFPGRNVH